MRLTLLVAICLLAVGVGARLLLHSLLVQNRSSQLVSVSCGRISAAEVRPKASRVFSYAVFGRSAVCEVATTVGRSNCAVPLRPFGDVNLKIEEAGTLDCYVPQ
jgi:hypothetical protein